MRGSFILTFLLLIGATLGASASPDNESPSTGHFKYLARVKTGGKTSELYRAEIPPEILGKIRADRGDLRLYDAAGKEVPYSVVVLDGKEEARTVAGREFNRSRKEGESTEIVFELSDPTLEVNSVSIETPNRNFRYPVTIEGSADREEWRVIADKVSIFDFTEDVHIRKLDLEIPTSSYRYYRIRVYHGKDEFQLTRVPFGFTAKSPRELVEVEAEVSPWTTHAKEKDSSAIVTMKDGPLPLGAMNLAASTPVFQRNITLAESESPERREEYVNFQLHRIRAARVNSEELTSYFGDLYIPSGKFLVLIHNGDDPPLSKVKFKFCVYKHYIFLPGGFKEPFTLYAGAAKVIPPQYEFAQLFSHLDQSKALPVSIGRVEPNHGYVPEREPVTVRIARSPVLLYAAYALAALFVLFLVFRTVKGSSSPD